jgi:type IV pilus assembly protein PilM
MKLRSYSQVFSTPNTLALSSTGIDLSDRSLKFVKVERKGNGLVLTKYGDMAIPPGIIESGKIKDTTKLVQILSALKKEQDLRYVRVAIPEELAYLFTITIPKVLPSEVRSAIELQIEEHIPLSAVEAVFDFKIIEETQTTYTCMVGAMPILISEEYLALFIQAGLTPISFEIEADALRRSIVGAQDEGTYMLVDFGQTRTGISIISKNTVFFTSTLDICGEDLTRIIAKNFSVSFDVAEKMKRTHGLRRTNTTDTPELFPVLLNTISILRDELNKHYIYWHTSDETAKRPKIEKIIFVGGNANMIGLSSYIATSMKVSVGIGNVWANMMLQDGAVPEISFDDSLSYATAIGLALADYYHD